MKSFSDQIKECKEGAANNPFQGPDKKVVFVCSMGILRSATAARMYAGKYNTRSAGTYDEALIQLSPILVAWANELVFVNQENYDMFVMNYGQSCAEQFNTRVLEIPDCYEHMHPKLIQSFKDQYEPI